MAIDTLIFTTVKVFAGVMAGLSVAVWLIDMMIRCIVATAHAAFIAVVAALEIARKLRSSLAQ